MDQRTILTLGLDIGDRHTHFCLLASSEEEVSEEGRVRTTPTAIEAFLRSRERCRVVLEVGTHSPWLSRLAETAGHEVLVANPRALRFIYGNTRKSDRRDAELLARVGRMDPKLLSPIRHRREETQRALLVLRVRDTLVSSRTKMVTAARGMAKALGARITKCSTPSFVKTARKELPEDLRAALDPLLDSIEKLTLEIRESDKRVEQLGAESYPETKLIRQVHGVGPVTALAFVLIIEDPAHFAKSRDVGPFLGMVPRRDQSGNADPQLRITKAGDSFLRRLLVQSAHYILGPFGEDSDLRRRGLALVERGGKAAKKRAVIATARKLAVMLHALWKTGEVYDPLHNAKQAA
ncbi:IS110 family transposase [bacterium]|nr:MAG: IS110 family transposase [bacterium]